MVSTNLLIFAEKKQCAKFSISLLYARYLITVIKVHGINHH